MNTAAPSKTLAKKRLVIFLAFTFVLTWGLDFVACTLLGAYENGESGTPAIAVPIAISMFFPLLGAIVANYAVGKENRIDLGLRPRIKGNVRFYLAAWFAPALVSLLGIILFFALNPQLFDPSMQTYLETMAETAGVPVDQLASQMPPMPMLIAIALIAALTYAPFINMIPAFGEEVGWRGLLFPTLCELMHKRAAVVVSGVIWGIWHAPIIAIGHNYGLDYPGAPWAGILVMIVACTTLGACMCYLRERTQSAWPCALAHGAVNAIANVGVVFCVAGQTLAGPSSLGYIAGIPMIALGIVCWLKIEE